MMQNPHGNLDVRWTAPAEEAVKELAGQQRFQNTDVKQWHEDTVRAYGARQIPQATKARIRYGVMYHWYRFCLLRPVLFRKPVHTGGIVAAEPEHITVTFKEGNRDLGAFHVYTDAQ